MNAYELVAGKCIDSLRQVERPAKELGAHEVRVKLSAAAINFRDLMIADGNYGIPAGQVVVPLSDGAGEVVEMGSEVVRVKKGDHVIVGFWPRWLDGQIAPEKISAQFGAGPDGTLAEQLVTDENALTIAPAGLSFAEAATIACAGVTAWNALFVRGGLKPGASVLILGTGGVSIWALQLAQAAGLRSIITSSSDEKLARARALGASETINYVKTPEWQDEVKRLTNGRGVDLVIEVGGKGTMKRSIEATRLGGTIVVVGGRAAAEGAAVEPGVLIGGAKTLAGMMVGSRQMQEDLISFIETTGIRPVIDRSYAFADAPAAFRHAAKGAFGKVVIDVG
jgi:NADPH:quinone reductase-like Zn-dependent oxidoreductase